MQWNDSYHENALLHQQHSAARRRHASGRVPRRADPQVNGYAQDSGMAKKEKVALSPATTRAKG